MSGTPIVSLENITFAYPGNPVLFRDLNFSLKEGDRIGLHGPNGSGKTTLLRLILGLETPQKGRAAYRGEALDGGGVLLAMRRRVGLVMQNSDDQLFSVTVLEDVAFGPLNLGLTRREAGDRAMETLAGMGLEKLAGRATHRLSAGEKKMAAIAGILAMRPEAILLDEPTASLDDGAKARVEEILRRQPAAMLLVSHDRDFLARMSASCIRMNDAGGVEEG